MLSRNLGSVYLAPFFTHKCCTAAEETIMLKLTLILAVLGVPIGVSAYAASSTPGCDASATNRCPEHCPRCGSQCHWPLNHHGDNQCAQGHAF
jgi:hypothetical protein